MKYQIDSQFEIPHNPEVDDKTRLDLIESGYAEVKTQARNLGKSVARITAISEEYHDKLQKLMTTQNYRRFREFMAKEKESIAELLFPRREPRISDQELISLREERNERAQNYLNKLDVELERLKALNKEAQHRMARIMRPVTPKRNGKPVQILFPSEVPKQIRQEKTNPWKMIMPPYQGWAWWYFGFTKGFSFTPTLFLNSKAGFIGNSNYLHDSDAGDLDKAIIKYETQIGMWYKMPSAGIIEVYIKAQPSWNEHYCTLYDEWGWSSSRVTQRNYISLQVGTGGRKFAQSSDWWEHGYTKGSWVRHYLKNGKDYWFHLFSTDAYAKGTWQWVKVGTRNYNHANANDVEVYSKVDFRWFINKVYLRSTGG